MGSGKDEPPHVVVIGGGPAGLMAAETVASAGLRVTICDGMPTMGRKLLMAGRGGLNLTHSEPIDSFLDRYGPERPRIESAVRAFAPADLIAWAEGLGETTFVGTSGRVFPKSMKASPLLRAWLRRLEANGVRLLPRHRLVGIDGTSPVVEIDRRRISIDADAIVLAMGGGSWPRLGSDGTWLDLLASKGVACTPLVATNCGVCVGWSQPFREKAEGQALKRIAVTCGVSARGEAIVTRGGLEGGVIYALSRPIRQALQQSGEALLHVDLRPDLTAQELEARLSKARKGESRTTVLRKWARLSPAAIALIREASGLKVPTAPVELAALIKAVPVPVSGLAGMERAISSAGGVAWNAIDDSYMLHALPGVFVAGEMIDWEAPTGGYLLQGAFATGRAAGRGVVAFLARRAAA